MANVHIVNLKQEWVNADGTIVSKDTDPMDKLLYKNAGNIRKEDIVINNTDVPNSAGDPTLYNYLIAEYVSGFHIIHIDQYIVITDNT